MRRPRPAPGWREGGRKVAQIMDNIGSTGLLPQGESMALRNFMATKLQGEVAVDIEGGRVKRGAPLREGVCETGSSLPTSTPPLSHRVKGAGQQQWEV